MEATSLKGEKHTSVRVTSSRKTFYRIFFSVLYKRGKHPADKNSDMMWKCTCLTLHSFFVFTMLSSISTWPYVTLSFLYMLVTMYSSQSSHAFAGWERAQQYMHGIVCLPDNSFCIISSFCMPVLFKADNPFIFFYGWTYCEYNNMPYMVISHPTPT